MVQIFGSVAVHRIENPPVNGLSHHARKRIAAAVDELTADASITALVLIGSEKVFSGGADIKEFDTPAGFAEPSLWHLVDLIESCRKPVVAAVGGLALGGGFELALACHYRVFLAGTKIGLPEVKLGILPGAGGTQRFPRAVGLEPAVNLIATGRQETIEAFRSSALVDDYAEANLEKAAIDFAHRIAAARPVPRLRDRKILHDDAEAYLQFARSNIAPTARQFPAALKCLEAVATSVFKTFDEGIAFEQECFHQLVATTASKSLRHAFFAEREAGRIPGVSDKTNVRQIRAAAVIGAGMMGAGIAQCFADANIPVVVIDTSAPSREKARLAIEKAYESAVNKGRMTDQQRMARMSLVTFADHVSAVASADIVIEAVFEDMEVKKAVFKQLDTHAKDNAILATNTSTLDIDEIAKSTRRPAEVVGMHFFSPAAVMRLLEIVRGAETAPEVLATVSKLAKTLRKVSVVARVCEGFIGNRMLEQYLRQAYFLLDEGVLPHKIDQALESWGMAMGPFKMMDLAGGDVGWKIRQARAARSTLQKYSVLPDLLCEKGRFGQKANAGWYRYEPGNRTPIIDDEISRLVTDHAKSLGQGARQIPADEIVDRCILALVNEGAALLNEGIAARASDINIVYVNGYGFPAFRGGPMFYADTLGLATVVRRMRQFAQSPAGDTSFWTPAALLVDLAGQGKTFSVVQV